MLPTGLKPPESPTKKYVHLIDHQIDELQLLATCGTPNSKQLQQTYASTIHLCIDAQMYEKSLSLILESEERGVFETDHPERAELFFKVFTSLFNYYSQQKSHELYNQAVEWNVWNNFPLLQETARKKLLGAGLLYTQTNF